MFKTMPLDEYLRDPAPEPSISSGLVSRLLDYSPRHAWFSHPRLNPACEISEPTADMEFGTACHALLLENDESRLVEVNADDWRTKAAKEQRDEARINGQIALLSKRVPDVYQMVAVARAAIGRIEGLNGFLDGGMAEKVMLWHQGGVWNRARPDYYNAEMNICMDYKTTAGSAEPSFWTGRQLTAMGYDVQAAHYLDGFETITGKRPVWLWLVQENSAPFECSIIGAGEATLDLGQQKVKQARNIFSHCLKADYWPGYPSQICWSEPPAWEISKWEERKLTEGGVNLAEQP
jgi:hypothetical protein